MQATPPSPIRKRASRPAARSHPERAGERSQGSVGAAASRDQAHRPSGEVWHQNHSEGENSLARAEAF